MILVGGGAVNFHGYHRHSADIDFWIDTDPENMEKLKSIIIEMGYELEQFPPEVMKGEQNISVKISPISEIELITQFNPGKKFEDAFNDADIFKGETIQYRVISYEDLITSKIKSGRPKDLLDIQELKRIREEEQ